MNIENILKVADAIENHSIPGLGFNMGTFVRDTGQFDDTVDHSGHDCDTVACIAGWAIAVKNNFDATLLIKTYEYKDDTELVEGKAREFLGLNDDQATRLFYGVNRPYDMSLRDIKLDQAVHQLRHLALTGEVDWNISL